jgi:hypothetical protein
MNIDEKNLKVCDFKWNDSLVKLFTQVYSGNFNSRLIDESIFKYSDYNGIKIDEKMRRFKIDAQKIPNFKADLIT